LRSDLIETFWATPLQVKLQSGLSRTFRSVNDARWFLENEWPIHHGAYYERALMYCRAAEQRQVSAEVAREAFLAACLEAGLVLEALRWRPSPRNDRGNVLALPTTAASQASV
jgi:hypothetical protein